MSTIVKDIDVTAPLTKQQRAELEALKGRPITYDDDCPPLTEEQLERFRRAIDERRAERKRETVTLRLRPQTLRRAKSLGKGYTRVLSDIIETVVSDEQLLQSFL